MRSVLRVNTPLARQVAPFAVRGTIARVILAGEWSAPLESSILTPGSRRSLLAKVVRSVILHPPKRLLFAQFVQLELLHRIQQLFSAQTVRRERTTPTQEALPVVLALLVLPDNTPMQALQAVLRVAWDSINHPPRPHRAWIVGEERSRPTQG